MKLSRALLALAAALPLAAFQQPENPPPYSVDFPAGWDASVKAGLATVVKPGSSANCNSYSVRMPGLASHTQAQLNDILTGTWRAAEWADVAGAQPAKVEVISTTVRAIGPYQLRTGVLMFRAGAMAGQTVDVQAHIGFSLKGGYAFNVGCYALPQHYPGVQAQIDAAVGSMRLK